LLPLWFHGAEQACPANPAQSLAALFGLQSIADFKKPELKPLFDDASAITHLTKDAPPVVMYYYEPDREPGAACIANALCVTFWPV
jgi:hypothetical protein